MELRWICDGVVMDLRRICDGFAIWSFLAPTDLRGDFASPLSEWEAPRQRLGLPSRKVSQVCSLCSGLSLGSRSEIVCWKLLPHAVVVWLCLHVLEGILVSRGPVLESISVSFSCFGQCWPPSGLPGGPRCQTWHLLANLGRQKESFLRSFRSTFSEVSYFEALFCGLF